MGLLSKAEGKKKSIGITEKDSDGTVSEIPLKTSQESQELDEKGKALRNRILRMSPGPSVPYTALSLLKVYGSFQAGICFLLNNGFYLNYTSVGLGVEKISIPQDKIYIPERALKSYFQFSDEQKQEIKIMDSILYLWGFPLDEEKPWNAVLILGCTDLSSFNPEKISLILIGLS